VLEDKAEMMMMYRSYLKNSGFHLIPASTVREAQEILEEIRPRVIILDVVLRARTPGACWRKSNEPPHPRRPRHDRQHHRGPRKAFHLGADDYLLQARRASFVARKLSAMTGAKRILIIDDDERDRYLLKQHFRESDLMVREASDGIEGIREAAQQRPNA